MTSTSIMPTVSTMEPDDLITIGLGIIGAAVAVTGSILAIWTAVTNRHDRRLERLRPKPDPVHDALEQTISDLHSALDHCRHQRAHWQDQADAERRRGDLLDQRLDAANLALAKLGQTTY